MIGKMICVGKYLKNIYKNRIKKNHTYKDDKNSFLNPKGYAGFFHTDYVGMKDRAIMGMDGNGGQSIMIDFDRGRIIVINSIITGEKLPIQLLKMEINFTELTKHFY